MITIQRPPDVDINDPDSTVDDGSALPAAAAAGDAASSADSAPLAPSADVPAAAAPTVVPSAAAAPTAAAAATLVSPALPALPSTVAQAPDASEQPWLNTGADQDAPPVGSTPADADMTPRSGSQADQWLNSLMDSIQTPQASQVPRGGTRPATAQPVATARPSTPAAQPTVPMPAAVLQPAAPAVPPTAAAPAVLPAAAIAQPAAPAVLPAAAIAQPAAPAVLPAAAIAQPAAPAVPPAAPVAQPAAATPRTPLISLPAGLQPKAPTVRPATPGATGANGLKPGAPALPKGATVNTYPRLAANKAAINAALDAQNASPSERQTIMAIGMQETNDMDPAERDPNKTGSSTNYSAFNLNLNMLQDLGFTGSPASLNDPRNVGSAVGVMLKGIRTWGESRFLNYERGGKTGFNDGVAYDCAGYRAAIAAYKAQFQYDPTLMTDSRRVEIDTKHQ